LDREGFRLSIQRNECYKSDKGCTQECRDGESRIREKHHPKQADDGCKPNPKTEGAQHIPAKFRGAKAFRHRNTEQQIAVGEIGQRKKRPGYHKLHEYRD
jgi:hypothetical protein